MSYSPLTVANYFISKSQEASKQDGMEMTPLKLIKLVYLAHGWNLALQNQPLITEPIEAWRYGPVIQSLYHQLKKFGNSEITAGVAPHLPEQVNHLKAEFKQLKQDDLTLALLSRVWEVYGNYTAIHLANLTHEEDSPWDIVWNQQGGKNDQRHVIDNSLIQSYFKTLAQT